MHESNGAQARSLVDVARRLRAVRRACRQFLERGATAAAGDALLIADVLEELTAPGQARLAAERARPGAHD